MEGQRVKITRDTFAEWKDDLVLVGAGPSRFVGVHGGAHDSDPGMVLIRESLCFVSNLQVRVQSDGQVDMMAMPRDLVPPDLMEPYPEHWVRVDSLVWIRSLHERTRKFFEERYLFVLSQGALVQVVERPKVIV
jgi:hypothetical protein